MIAELASFPLVAGYGETPAGPATSDPPAIEFAGIRQGNARILAYHPGRPLPHHNGLAAGEVPHREFVTLSFLTAGRYRAGVGPLAAARARLAEAREKFLAGSDEYATHGRLVAQAAELRRAVADADRVAPAALAEARRLLVAGQDPAEAEARYREALAEREVLANRLTVIEPAGRTARDAAERSLFAALERVRRQIEAEAVAEARRLADELTAAVGRLLWALSDAEQLAYWANGSTSAGLDHGRGVGETAAAEFARLD